MTTELDTKALRAQFEAATPGEWYVGAQNDAVYIIDRPPDATVPVDYVREGGPAVTVIAGLGVDLPLATLIVTMRNTYAALLDRVEQADKYEAALRELAGVAAYVKLHPRFHTTETQMRSIAKTALEEPDAD